MKNMYILVIIILVVIVIAMGRWYYTNNKNVMNNQRVYSLSNVDLDISGAAPEFKHVPKPGKSFVVFIVILPNNQYLIARFSWLVVPNPTVTQDENTTYVFANGKFSPIKADLKYSLADKTLEGQIPLPTGQDQNAFISIYSKENDIISVNSASEFKQITSLPGFEHAMYTEE